jgi:hypothetical protein
VLRISQSKRRGRRPTIATLTLIMSVLAWCIAHYVLFSPIGGW